MVTAKSSQLETYNQESKKCAIVMSLLTSQAHDWASTVWDNDSRSQTLFEYFISQYHKVFEYPEGGQDVSDQQSISPLNSELPQHKVDVRVLI